MGRGLAILAVFAVAIGVFVYWGPLQLTTTTRQSKADAASHAASSPAETGSVVVGSAAERRPETPAGSDSSTAPPIRKTQDRSVDQKPRDAVLASTSPLAASALAVLPERTIPGFPRTPQAALSSDQLASALKQAKYLRADGQLVEARDLLSDVYLNNRTTHEQRVRLAGELEPLSLEILQSLQILGDGQLYEVEPGDVLVKLCKPFRVPPEFVMKLNGIKRASSIRPRQTLKLVQGPFDVLVELNELELTVLQKGKFIRRFSIGVGKDDTPTPMGLNTVHDKGVDPIKWPDPVDRRKIAGGDPENPFGSRWIGIGLGYGIHGTNEPETIGQKSSRGCVRMRNHDVEELYDMVTEGSRVLIR